MVTINKRRILIAVLLYFGLSFCSVSGSSFSMFQTVRLLHFKLSLYPVSVWLYKACTDNTQCLARNSECFAGTCLCTPGYYYSNTSLSCLDSKSTDTHVVSVITTPALTSTVLTVSAQLYMSSLLLLLQYSRLLYECWSSKWTVIHVVSAVTTPALTSPV